MYEKALVAIDGSAPSYKAVGVSGQLAQAGSIKAITLLYVVSIPHAVISADGLNVDFIPEYQEKQQKVAYDVMQKAREILGPNLEVNTLIETGSPAETIVKVVDKYQYDLVIIGNRGLNQLQRLLLGSVSTKVVSAARCSVLVVK